MPPPIVAPASAPIHPHAAVVGIVHVEAVDFIVVRQGDGSNFVSDIAEFVIRALVHSAAVHNADGTACLCAAGAVGVCHVISCHIAITFLKYSVVCVVVIYLTQRVVLRQQITGVVVGVAGFSRIGMYAFCHPAQMVRRDGCWGGYRFLPLSGRMGQIAGCTN